MIVSKQSVHLIIGFNISKNGNVIAYDNNHNRIVISKNLLNVEDFKSIKKIFPFYLIAYIEKYSLLEGVLGDKDRKEVKTADGKNVQFKRLTARFIFPKIENLIGFYTEKISTNIENFKDYLKEIMDYIEQLKNSLIIYETHIKRSIYNKVERFNDEESDSLFFRLIESITSKENDGIEIVAPSFYCSDIWGKIINKGFNFRAINDNEWDTISNISEYLKIENKIAIKELHLYTEARKVHISSLLKRRILKIDDFKKIKIQQNWKYYLTQFYHLKPNPILDKDEDKYLESFDRERISDFKERCKNEFNDYKLYTITPILNIDSSFDDISKIHIEIISLINFLNSLSIYNVIILPPINDLDITLQMNEYYNGIEYNTQNDNGNYPFDDIVDDEIRSMDKESDGSWRIENDLD